MDARGLNGGYKYGAKGGTEQDAQFVRSAMYGSFLSGGLAGHVYGAEAIWGGDVEPAAPIKMWDAFHWRSAAQMQYLRTFAFSLGKRYQELVPCADLVSPNKTHILRSYEGWAYCARTPDKEAFLLYFEISRRAAPAARSEAPSFRVRTGPGGLIRGPVPGRAPAAGRCVRVRLASLCCRIFPLTPTGV